MASPLESFKILIADCDQYLANVSRRMLQGMGFSKIHITPSGTEALGAIKEGSFDFLITDWYLKDMDGITLINHIRRDPDSPNPTMPVIMLTGRMEMSDVLTARDNGIHEYVVKPFSAQTIYDRLERIVEFPRHFVVGKEFVGPDRRHKRGTTEEKERRNRVILPQRKPRNAAERINMEAMPALWLPDFTLKHKLGENVTLESVITPAVLLQAQSEVNASAGDSLEWIKNDVASLQTLSKTLATGKETAAIINEMNEVALMVSSRSGTFGFRRASEVAYMLYLFGRKKFQPGNPNHYTVVEKHIEVLQIIFGTKQLKSEDAGNVEIIKGLKKLTDKFAP